MLIELFGYHHVRSHSFFQSNLSNIMNHIFGAMGLYFPPNRRGSAASGWASLLACTRSRLNPLVVRREATRGQRMIYAAIVAGA
jgi:hypothetical protein